MIKKALSLAMFLMSMLCVSAQQPQLTPLPLNPNVKSGVLPNGLSYYILHNAEPKERANFYIAQKVGSTLETPSQLGLAHFLEHMAFNGTTNYPGKAMLNYLQSKGIRFGADINAYTSFDETVYNINNVPTTDQALMDSVLLVLHDWSGGIALETSEINAERGVIQEEWRQRNDARSRMMESILPKIYKEYQYQQTPIGKMDVVMNFEPDTLRAYYKKWYRPDQQGIVIVGDFDAAAMEQKVKDLFSGIPMPANAAERTYPNVSDNEKPIYASFEDPELTNPLVMISFKSDVVPFEMRNTVEMYAQKNLLEEVIADMINNRLSEYSKKAECDYAAAGCYFDDFLVSKTKDAFNINIVPKADTKAAVEDALAVVARALKTGFTDSELARVRDEIISQLEKAYNEREKTNNDALASELIRHFVDNEPAPGPEIELQIARQILQMIPVQAINQMCQEVLTPNNQVIVESIPKKEPSGLLGENVMVGIVDSALNATYEAYVDEVITDPLIASLPKPGSVKSTSENAEFGTTTFTLSNGIKVVLKTTDFAADEILMNAYRMGGKNCYPSSEANEVLLMEDAYELSKMGPFDVATLPKYLAGKRVSLGFSVNNYTEMLDGSSTVKDLPTLMELIYTSFTNLTPDYEAYKVQMEKAAAMLADQDKNPQKIFFEHVNKALYNGNPIMQTPTAATIKANNMNKTFELLHAALANPAEWTFIFTGSVTADVLKPMLEQYIASLPVSKVVERKAINDINMTPGIINDDYNQPMQSPAVMVFDNFFGDMPFNLKDSKFIQLTGDLLDDNYVQTLREEEGGTYGASVSAALNPIDGKWRMLYVFQTNNEMKDKLVSRAYKEFEELLNEGAEEKSFQKAKEAALKQYEINVRTNSYWKNNLSAYERGINMISGEREAIESVTLPELNKFMKNLYNGKNRIQVIMTGTPLNN